MKRIYLISAFLFITTITGSSFANAATIDTSDWYQYNGYSRIHSFSLRFPTDWQSYIISDDLQGFGPKTNQDSEPVFLVEEFENQTYDQMINYTDFIFHSTKEDLPAKKALNKTFFKRGSLIVALSSETENYQDIINAIHDSFEFTDDWHQYINFSDRYGFIFPADFEIQNIDSGVQVLATIPIFTVIEDVLNEANSQEDINFHGMDAVQAIFEDEITNKNFSKIFVEKNGNTYSLSDINIENNFPVSNYYNEYIAEMLESFEFFELDYKNFPDVKNDHPNSNAIDNLVEEEVISGYPDGTFKPDGLINRAELTKMVVETVTTPSSVEFKNCFPDVKEEWFAPYICYAKKRGWVEGYNDGKFKPAENINRVEALKIILNVIFEEIPQSHLDPNESPAKDIDLNEWYAQYFTFADVSDLLDRQHVNVSGDSYFYYPQKEMTRKEVAETIYRSLVFTQ